MELSETIRANIAKMINEAKGSIIMSLQMEHMMTQICYEMYKHGMKDGHRICIKCLEVSKENLDV